MNVSIDENICTGCGLCVDTCPDVFLMNEDVAIVNVDKITKDNEELCGEAKENCPVEAILIKI